MSIPGEFLRGPKSTPEWCSSLRVQYLKESIQAVIGLKQPRDQDSLNTYYLQKLFPYNVDQKLQNYMNCT